MDRFTRNYLIFLGLIALALLGWWLSSWNPRIAEINDILEADPQLSTYPYPFRVVSLKNGVAELSTPRSAEVPVIQFLGVIQPNLRGKSQDNPDIMAAQADLVTYQKRAEKLVQDQPDITSIRWTLDRDWYVERGIVLN